MRRNSAGSVLAFVGVPETLVDQMLEHLRDASCLPGRCLVFSSNMQLMGALVNQWEGEVEIVAAIAPVPIADMKEVIELIAESEGLLPEQVLWVGSDSDLGHVPVGWRRFAFNERSGSKGVAQALAQAMSH